MDYFKDREKVKEYITLAEGYDGRMLIEILKKHLKDGSTVLELGMGPGKDLEILGETYKATGTDYSDVFIDMYKDKVIDADVFLLDAVTMDTERKFDCIYSNKVLQHIKKEELVESFKNQKEVLNADGILFHSLWLGSGIEEYEGMTNVYYQIEEIKEMVEDDYEVISTGIYDEMENGDSFYIILRKK